MVDVWISDCNWLAVRKSCFFGLLSPEERIRSERYLQPRKRESFVLTRGMMRSVLSKYLDSPPEDIRFAYGEHGKPELKTIHKGVYFNLTHSGEIAVLAVSGRSRVGVDVERMDRDPERLDRIMEFLCPSEEMASYMALSRRDRALSAYYLWTANEAYLKGVGSGFERLESKVTWYHRKNGDLRISLRKGHDEGAWCFRHFNPFPGSVATLAMESCDPEFEVNFHYLD